MIELILSKIKAAGLTIAGKQVRKLTPKEHSLEINKKNYIHPDRDRVLMPDALNSIEPKIVNAIRSTLTRQESAYQQKKADKHLSSLWAHSSRVGRIAHRIAVVESLEPTPALLAGLFHDTGKFARGTYHENDIPEEEDAVHFVERILSGTEYEKWVPTIKQAILSMFGEAEATSAIGCAVYDGDRLDKLGHMGVAQFFAKGALRGRFLSDELIIRASIELTYAHHAPHTLKTATGRQLARQRQVRTHRFYTELLEELDQLGLGSFTVRKEEISGIICIFVVPTHCVCGGNLKLESDIQDALKCRSAIVQYLCEACGTPKEFSFCLPRISGFPPKAQE